MAVAVLVEVEGAGLETYEAVNAAMGGLVENPPEGLLVHTAAARDGGGYFVFNVWESAAARALKQHSGGGGPSFTRSPRGRS